MRMDAASRWGVRRIRSLRTGLIGGLLLGMLSLAAGCVTGRVVGEAYLDFDSGFQVGLPPPSWRPRSLDGAALAFESAELRAAVVLLVECDTPEPGDLPWVARHLFFGLEAKQVQERETLRLHDAIGVRTRLAARLDDAPVEVEGVTFRRAGCLYDFIYAAPPAAFPRGRPVFEAFVESWAPLPQR